MNTGKTVVVTGGAGFIGSHLCERLVHDGHRVISLDNYFTGTPENHVEGVEYREGHTKDIATHVPEDVDLVFHLGEYSRVEKSFEDVEVAWDLNKPGTFAVLEFCRRGQCKLVYAGSSTKFADGGEGRDQSPYAWMKATNTELVQNYGDWFGLTYAITYFYNAYGPREMTGSYGTVVGIFSQLYQNNQPLPITAPGTQSRNFTHVADIVSGLILVAEKGEGDGYGIGADESFSIQELANLFGGATVMMPARLGTRQCGGVDNTKVKALGWQQRHDLPTYIEEFKNTTEQIPRHEQSVLVFTTTFVPDAGPAEWALVDLMQALPDVQFDVITTVFSQEGWESVDLHSNITIHRVGNGRVFDKYLLPVAGARIARKLQNKHEYIFTWSLFASYAALAAQFSRMRSTPLLITLADQDLQSIPWYLRFILKFILKDADQIHADDTREAHHAIALSKRTKLVRSIGKGDAFASQLRFAYSRFLQQRCGNREDS